MAIIAKEEEGYVKHMFEKAVNEEKVWANYLFKEGSMIGLNDRLLHNYVEWIANKRMKAIGLDPMFDVPAKIIHSLGHSIGCLQRVYRMHHKKRRSKVMSSEESNKTSKQTHSQDSLYDAMFDDLLEEANDMSSPDLTDMIWATARKEALRKSKNVSE